MKSQGQQAVSRIIQLRQFYKKSNNINAKQDYANQFKSNIIKLVSYIRVQTNPNITSILKSKLPDLQQQLRGMRQQIKQIKQKNQKQIQQQNNKNSHNNKTNQKKNNDKDDQKINNNISDAIVRQKPNVKWEDIGGLQQAKKVLQQAIILPIKFPQIFVGERTPWKGILMYGPPGTGKTFLAKACATEMKGGTFFSISASDLMSKYVGQSQKTLRALFDMANKQAPSIIFIDEIDSIAGQRSSDQNQVSRRIKTQLLICMQGVGRGTNNVLVLGATNLPWALDPAVRRRFQKRVYIPLPDIKGRLAMIRKVVQKNNLDLNSDQISQLAQMTNGYSGSDITIVGNDALMAPVRKLNNAFLWKQVVDQNGKVRYCPVTHQQNGYKYFKGTKEQLKAKGYQILLVTQFQDFANALKNSKPSVSQQDLGKYVQWTKSFGVDG